MRPLQTLLPADRFERLLQELAELASRSGLSDVKAMALAFEAVRLVNTELAALPNGKDQ
jgi:hypothetical protein